MDDKSKTSVTEGRFLRLPGHKRSLSMNQIVPDRSHSLPGSGQQGFQSHSQQQFESAPIMRVERREAPPETPMFHKHSESDDGDNNAPHTYEQGWSKLRTAYVRRMGERAGGYRWMHGQAAKHFTRWYYGVGYTVIIVQALANIGNIPYVAACQTELNWIKWCAIVIGFLVTIVMAFQQLRDFGSRRSMHFMAEQSYGGLYEQIRQEVQKNTWERQDAEKYMEWISKDFNELKLAGPAIPASILNTYRSKIAGTSYADPENIDEIVVKEDSPPRQSNRRNNSVAAAEVTALSEIVIDKPTDECTPPRAGRLMRRSYSFSAGVADSTETPHSGFLHRSEERQQPTNPTTISPMDQIALERWNNQ